MYGEKIAQLKKSIERAMAELNRLKVEGFLEVLPTVEMPAETAPEGEQVQQLRRIEGILEDAVFAGRKARRAYDERVETIQLGMKAQTGLQYGQKLWKQIAFAMGHDAVAWEAFQGLVADMAKVEKIEFVEAKKGSKES